MAEDNQALANGQPMIPMAWNSPMTTCHSGNPAVGAYWLEGSVLS